MSKTYKGTNVPSIVERHVFRAQLKKEQSDDFKKKSLECLGAFKSSLNERQIVSASLFKNGQNLFYYCETYGGTLPLELLSPLIPLLKDWPGENQVRKWISMMDIFHHNIPISFDHWQRKLPVTRRVGMVQSLNPGMIASYIFWHYQRQEEQPAQGNKYALISIHENLCFFYQEFPEIIEMPPLYKGLLKTNNTPLDKATWNKLMLPHFLHMEDPVLEFWPEIELVITV